jgi:site-specific DNA recombinase
MTNEIKAAIYCRVSSEDQARHDKVSLASQREKCETYLTLQGWEPGGVYEDAGVSGAKSSRPALDLMLEAARQGRIQRVVFWKLDRLARNLRHLLNISAELESLGVGIVSVNDGFDTGTSAGRLYRSILGAVAEFERELIGERTTIGKLGRAKQGKWVSGQAPYGYDVDLAAGALVVNEDEAETVRRIFRLYLQDGLSQVKIAALLNRENVPTKTARASGISVDGQHQGWWRGTIARLLASRTYVGEAYYNKTARRKEGGSGPPESLNPKDEWVKIDCPAIISEETWTAAQEKARHNQRFSRLPKDTETVHLLRGLLRCDCGRAMAAQTVRRVKKGKHYANRYYICAGQRLYGILCRPAARVPADKLEAEVMELVIHTFSEPANVLAAVRAYADEFRAARDGQEGRAKDLQGRLAGLDEERDRLITLCSKGVITDGALSRHLARLDTEAEEWKGELERMAQASEQLERAKEIEASAHAIAERIRAVIGNMTTLERKGLLRDLVDRVWVDSGNKIRIDCGVPGMMDKVSQATRCDVPVACMSSFRSSGMSERAPKRMPVASAASGSGRTPERLSARADRTSIRAERMGSPRPWSSTRISGYATTESIPRRNR